MSLLKDRLEDRQKLENQGYTDDQIKTAALMVIADNLNDIGACIETIMEAIPDGAD